MADATEADPRGLQSLGNLPGLSAESRFELSKVSTCASMPASSSVLSASLAPEKPRSRAPSWGSCRHLV